MRYELPRTARLSPRASRGEKACVQPYGPSTDLARFDVAGLRKGALLFALMFAEKPAEDRYESLGLLDVG